MEQLDLIANGANAERWLKQMQINLSQTANCEENRRNILFLFLFLIEGNLHLYHCNKVSPLDTNLQWVLW